MGENSKIEWCDDSISFWWGCTRYGEGCRNCYAERMSKRSGDFWGPKSHRLYIKSAMSELLRLNRKAKREGRPRIVFINSMSDFFEQHDGPVVGRSGDMCVQPNGEPATLDTTRSAALKTMQLCGWLRCLLLTKRPENIRTMLAKHELPWNLWLGTSIATQADAERNIPLLLECRDLAPVLFLSIEPLVEPVFLRHGIYVMPPDGKRSIGTTLDGIDWVICGGESGHGARPCEIEWIKSIIRQCDAAGVPCFVKQLGSVAIERESTSEEVRERCSPEFEWPEETHFGNGTLNPAYNGRRVLTLDRKGGDWNEWPMDLRIREFPEVSHGRA